jgi:hypothetical protein
VKDPITERLIQEVFARVVPDDEQRREIAARVHIRDLMQDPDVVAARQLLASASPQELDAAFLALERYDALATPPAAVDDRPLSPGRLRRAAETLKAGVARTGDRFQEIFVATLIPAGAMRGDRRSTEADHPESSQDEARSFAFRIPERLAQLSGLESEGSAEIRAGTLHIVISRTLEGGIAPVSVVAITDGQVTDPVEMVPDPEYPELLSASMIWPHPLTAGVDVIIAVGSEP